MSHRMVPRALLALFLCLVACGCAPGRTGNWQQVGRGPLYNVSGMAAVGEGSGDGHTFLVVHDNKKPAEPRVGAVTVRGDRLRYRPLRWPAGKEPPADLEAVSPVPGAPGRFLALTSAGRLLHLKYGEGGGDVDVVHESELPDLPRKPNFEGLAVQDVGGRTVVAWGDRGDGRKPGTLYWGAYDAADHSVSQHGEAPVRVPFPAGRDVRHITDLHVDGGGVVWAAASTDPGDEGPFVSAVYAIGSIGVGADGKITFRPNPNPARLSVFDRKVEAIELVAGANGRAYFGADDEARGGWIRAAGR